MVALEDEGGGVVEVVVEGEAGQVFHDQERFG